MTAASLGVHDLPLFVLSGLLLNITPGADSLYIVTRSIAQGTRAGIAAALGIAVGCAVHVLAGALGLSALLATSAAAFAVLKIAGAAYLVFVGLSMIRGSFAPPGAAARLPVVSLRSVFAQGLLTNVLNPKVALFFLAFMPQFIDANAAGKAQAFLALGAVFMLTGTLWCLFLAWSAARLRVLRTGSHAGAWLARGAGAAFVLLGARLALADRG